MKKSRLRHVGQPLEKLEPRLALSVTTIERDSLVERDFTLGTVGDQPGQLVVASDQGSDVYLQKIDMTPEELLVADNGSFLDYMAIENVDVRFDEFIVTNGSEHVHEEAITADQWWLFPTKTNDNAVTPTDDPLSTENLTTTRLALDRPEIVIGPHETLATVWPRSIFENPTAVFVAGSDFFGSVSYLQSDGTLTKWTYSAWDGAGNTAGDYRREFGEPLYITSGPGFGGGPISYKNTLVAPITPLLPGHIFPRKISVVTEQLPENLQDVDGKKWFGGRRHYLEVEWSQTPVVPPVMEANYWGTSGHHAGLEMWCPIEGVLRDFADIRDPFSRGEDVPPTVGVAMRTNGLRVTIPQAITEGSPDGSPSLGIIPGTASGTLVIGGVGQEEIYRTTFEDRKNAFPREDTRIDQDSPSQNDKFTLFFNDYDNSGAISTKRTFGLVEGEIETNVNKDIDWRFREQADTRTYIEGVVKDASVLEFGIGSVAGGLADLNKLYNDNSLNDSLRALDGINVIINEDNLLDGTARDAVRIEHLDYHVYVKPAVPNEAYFVAAADFTRAVTVDLLTEGSSVYVNSPVRVENPSGDIDLRATNVMINAPLETDDYIILGRSNSEESPRLPRASDPQGGELSTPTFLGSLLTDDSTTRTVAPTPVLNGFGVGTLEVLPGREGYGYDPSNPPVVRIEAAPVVDATVKVSQVAGGVGELLLNDGGQITDGIGVDNLEYLHVQFDEPQLRAVDSVNRWTRIQNDATGEYDLVPAPEGYFAAPVIAISQPEIVASATRIGYGVGARVSPDNEWGNGVGGIRLNAGGSNYSRPPTITLRTKKPDEYPPDWQGDTDHKFWDERIPIEYRSFPTFDFDFDLQLEPKMDTSTPPKQVGSRFLSSTIRGLELKESGFGLNIQSLEDLTDHYIFEFSGGHNPTLRDNGFLVEDVPPPEDIEFGVIEITDALFGTLAWKGSSSNDQVTPRITRDPNDPGLSNQTARLLDNLLNANESVEDYTGDFEGIDDLENRGQHYEFSPDVQFIGKLTGDVALEFRVDEDFDGDSGVAGDLVYGDQVVIDGGVTHSTDADLDGKQFYRATIENVFAFADGTDNFGFAKGKFRDLDYLSYLNDRQKEAPNGQGGVETHTANKVITAHASVDGQNWFRVVPVKADSLENFYHPAKGVVGKKELTLNDGFTNWHYLSRGMTITLPTATPGSEGQKVRIVQWFENTGTIVIDEAIKEGFSETDRVEADNLAGLAFDEQPRGIRFGADRNIVDVYRQQFNFRLADYETDEYYWPPTPSNSGYTRKFAMSEDSQLGLLTGEDLVNADINPMKVKHFRFYMDPWFEQASLDDTGERTGDPEKAVRTSGVVQSELKAFASMGSDPARGRAVLSGQPGSRTITNLEVTHPGSGYTKTPGVTFGVSSDDGFAAVAAGTASARAIVTGGIYELDVTEAGFNYFGDILPGLATEVVRNVTIPVFDVEDLPTGAKFPAADFFARNTSVRAGSIVDPGAGLKIIGSGDSNELAGFDQSDLVLEPGEGLAIDEAVFQAIVEPDGRILRFEKLRSGSGYRIAPTATVDSPLPPRSATAFATINSSLGTVTGIDVLDEGYRYSVAPRVYVLPPTPRGEGRAATAVSVLGPSGEVMRIDITDPGAGYTAPPVVLVQKVDAFSVVENVDVAAHISASKYEWYVSRSDWTDLERGSILLRPTNTLGYAQQGGGTTADWIVIEAAATDITFEGNVDATDVTILMNSRLQDQPYAPYELTTLSTATGTHSGTLRADQLVVTMGNDVPTPLSGGALVNRVALQTDVRTLRATAAESARNPRGAFPYDIQIDALDSILVEAVARSSGEIEFNVPGDLDVKAGILTDGDISITTKNFNQTTPLETEFGQISIVAEDIDVLNSVLVKAAPLDERNSDISLHATSGSIDLQGTVSSPNSIYIRQQGAAGQVGGNTRLNTQELRVEAEGSVDVFTDVDVVYGSSDFGDFTANELNDVRAPTLQVPNGVIRLTANGVDRGGNAINPIALTARVVEGQQLFVSAPHGSVDVDVDTSSDLSLGVPGDLAAGTALPMLAAGRVRIVNASGSIDVLDGPVSGQNAKVVKAASTARLPDIHAYAPKTPGEFPSELSGPGKFPESVFEGAESIRVGDFLLLKDQFDRPETGVFDESRENGVYEVMRLGGGNAGFQDWLLRRAVDADSRPDLLPGSYVRVLEGKHRGEVFQVQYSVLPALGVTRTTNNQLVIDSGVGGLLAVDVNDVVSGYGIVPGARVTGVDYANGVVTLGVGNGYEITAVDENARTVIIKAEQSLLFDSLRYAKSRGERAIISGHWFEVGAEVTEWNEETGLLKVELRDRQSINQSINWKSGIRQGVEDGIAPEGSRAIVGFTSASSDRISLNPAVRTFLINSIQDESQYNVEATRTITGKDDDADQQNDYARIVNPATLARSRNTIDVIKTKLEGWTVRVGDEVTYSITDRYGRKTDHINRVVSVVDGNATSQDDVANGLLRIGLAEATLVPSYVKDDGSYKLPDLALRNRARVAPNSNQQIAWDALHVGMQVKASGASDRTTRLIGQGYRLPDGSAYRYEVDTLFRVYGRLEIGMAVTGESVPPNTILLGFDAENGTVDLNSRLFDTEQPVTFGNPFTTLIDWDERENFLTFSDELETNDFSVDMGFTVESFEIKDEVKLKENRKGSGYSRDTERKIEVYFGPPDTPVSKGGIQMEGYAVPDGDGGIKRVVVTRQGGGYDSIPEVIVANPPALADDDPTNDSGSTRAEAEVILNRGTLYKGSDSGRFEFLTEAQLSEKGRGYSTNRDVVISVDFGPPNRSLEDGAVQMEGYAVPDGSGGIAKIVVTQAGFGYDQSPEVTIAAPAGMLDPNTPNDSFQRAEGYLPNFQAGGEKILVSFSPPNSANDGVRIRGYAVPDEIGGISQVIVTEPGSGYTEPPTVQIDVSPQTGGVRAKATISNGLGYSADTGFKVGVRFSAPDTLTGVQMLGYAVPDGEGGLEKVVITQQGRGYTKTPTVDIDPPLNPSPDLLGLRAAGVVKFDPTYVSEVSLQNLLGGSDDAVSMTPNFTNYDGLRPGQPVFGDGVKPGTVITRVLPAIRRVEVTPGGLPVRLTVDDSPADGDELQLFLTRSQYYTDGFEHYLQMPRTFNEFHKLTIGQRVRFPGDEWADTVITAIDPTYRQIGIRPPEAHILDHFVSELYSGDVVGPKSISKLVFDSLDRVEFGMIDRTGTGTASFSVTPFGYEAITMATPAVASGLGKLGRVADEDSGAFEIELSEFSDERQLKRGRRLSGVGLRPGYRIESYDGKNLVLYSAKLNLIEEPSGEVNQGDYYFYSVDSGFTAWSSLVKQMPVYVTGANKSLLVDFDLEERWVKLDTNLGNDEVTVVFGMPFTDKWLAQGVGSDAMSGVSVHLENNRVSSHIAAGNLNDQVHYRVSTAGSTSRSAGSLGRIMLVAQRNEYHADDSQFAGGKGTQPEVVFDETIRQIELSEPLPSIVTNAISVNGAKEDGTVVEVMGRFINQTESGDTVLSSTVVNGFVIDGADASGTILKNMRIGGFSNGSAIRIDGVSNAVISDMTIGVTGDRIRSASRYGVLVTGESASTTIQNTEVVSSEQAAIRIDDGAIKTRIIGSTIGINYGSQTSPDLFWNETGIEVVADNVAIGVEPLSWKSADAQSAINVSGELRQGDDVVELSLTSQLWSEIVPGLAVIGVGLLDSTFIESVDTLNRRITLSKGATRDIATANLLIGYQAFGDLGSGELELSEAVPIDRVFPGQAVRVVSGLNPDQVFDTTIIRVEEDGRKLHLAEKLPNVGMYEKAIHLVDFGEPAGNEIRYSRNGVVVGLFGKVSATSSSNLLNVSQDFTGWSSLREGMEVFVRYAEPVANEPVPDDEKAPYLFETKITGWSESSRTITVDKEVPATFLLRPARFGAANELQMVNTTVADSIEDGLVFGGGERHSIGFAVKTDVHATAEGARVAGSEGQGTYELGSYKLLASIDRLGLLQSSDSAVVDWLKTEIGSRSVSVFGSGIPEGTEVESVGTDGRIQLSKSPNEEISNARIYFGLGVFVTAERGLIQLGNRVDGRGNEDASGETDLYEYTSVEHLREPYTADGSEKTGFIALSTPREGLLNVSGRGRLPKADDSIVFVDRGQGNTVINNAGLGISTISIDSKLSDTLLSGWSITGNFIDVSYNRELSLWEYFPNTRGPIDPDLFAKIFGEPDPEQLFSSFDRTDAYGNQYALERLITESNEPDDPFGDSSGGSGSGTTGSDGGSGGGSGGGSDGGFDGGSGGESGGIDNPFDPGVDF